MDGGTLRNHETAKEGTPTGTRPGEGGAKVQPAKINYVEKAKAEMKWIEDIQNVLQRVEQLQKKLDEASVDDELLPIAEDLRKKLKIRKANFEKYFSRIGSPEDSGMS